MRAFDRRRALGLGLAVTADVGLAGCGAKEPGSRASVSPSPSGPGRSRTGGGQHGAQRGQPSIKLIGDGSTAFTGQQPRQPAKPVPL
ncbi:hypothetical protein AB0H77_27315, partial [Streptomyces sp. NPDC050844]